MREIFGSCCASNVTGRAVIAAPKRPMKSRRFTKKFPSAPPAARGRRENSVQSQQRNRT
jgi:hypothetical protein